MANISDIIESFILDLLKQDDNVNLSRNELANYFNCAPSQINYVLSTRFTNDRGYNVVSRRGGSGYIKLIKLDYTGNDYLQELITERLKEPLDYISCKQILSHLVDCDIISENEFKLIYLAVSPKALANPIHLEDKLRSQILKNVLIGIESKGL